MKIKVTKRQVIKALQTEPLLSGSYVHTSYNDFEDVKEFENNVQCPVCAVGAILDTTIGSKFTPEQVSDLGGELVQASNELGYYAHDTKETVSAAKKMIKEFGPLSALSSLFEALSTNAHMKTNDGFTNYRLRRILINFVKKNFPAKLVIDTNSRY